MRKIAMIVLLLCFGKRKFYHIKVTKSRYVNASRGLVATNGIDRVNMMVLQQQIYNHCSRSSENSNVAKNM
ncbi:hypothetical protein [Chryseobacterium rhizoplanae]|uniref:hypothetical protein n=1 Tax=Chryseobacterium rhizoplanae TaxID=1609531 RepID=UPI0011599949|nr:hypothetical protein [Chryseobacterium rhizoplanae]